MSTKIPGDRRWSKAAQMTFEPRSCSEFYMGTTDNPDDKSGPPRTKKPKGRLLMGPDGSWVRREYEDDDRTYFRRVKGEETVATAQDLLRGLMAQSQTPLADGFLRLRLDVQWEKVVGPRLAKVSKPQRYDRGVLYVRVAHPTWIQELRFIEAELRQKINAAIGSNWCREIKFVT